MLLHAPKCPRECTISCVSAEGDANVQAATDRFPSPVSSLPQQRRPSEPIRTTTNIAESEVCYNISSDNILWNPPRRLQPASTATLSAGFRALSAPMVHKLKGRPLPYDLEHLICLLTKGQVLCQRLSNRQNKLTHKQCGRAWRNFGREAARAAGRPSSSATSRTMRRPRRLGYHSSVERAR